MFRRAIVLALSFGGLTASLPGCHRSNSSGPDAGRDGAVLALVAASTKDAVQEITDRFSRDTGIAVKLNADDSSKLAEQIVHGAPADVFLSANEKWADYVKDQSFAEETHPLLGNSLVLVVPTDNPGKVSTPDDLTDVSVKKVAVAGPTVPAGIYARQALRHLKLWDDLEKQKKIVAGENVRVTLTYVEQGEVEAGIVYSTDAKITNKVQTVYTFPASSHDKIAYPLVLLKAGAKRESARKYNEYLRSEAAAEIFRKYGFVAPVTK